jgi:hypothetical protein
MLLVRTRSTPSFEAGLRSERAAPQAQLVDILDEYQPSVSSPLKGRISQVSIEKLLRYADRLHLQTSIAVRPIEGRIRRVKTQATASARRPARKLAVAS